MLEDFIQANSLEAKVLPFPAKQNLVKCRLFSCGSFDVLAVFFASDRVSIQKMKKALDSSSIKFMGSTEAEQATGYKAEFMPPISIYGVKAVVDKKLFKAEKVRCLIAEEKTLEISPKEIIEANEEALEADITE